MNENKTDIPYIPSSKVSVLDDGNANEIVLYQPDDTISLDVRLEGDTVWLTQSQMTVLFETSKQNISLHTNNIFKEGELDKNSVVKESLTTASDGKNYRTKYYNLDVIISVGYRVKSLRGTQFRIWATGVLREYLMRGYAVAKRFERLEYRVAQTEEKIDFLVKTSLPPKEGIFFDGQIFDAYAFVADLIRMADKRIIVVDNYLDDTVLVQLSKRKPGVIVDIYDGRISSQLRQDVARHNEQYPGVSLHHCAKAHDRFLIIDETVYHVGHSLKDLGKKMFAFSRMEAMSVDDLLAKLNE